MLSLEKEAPQTGSRVVALLGNDEIMNIMGDVRYVTPENYASCHVHDEIKTFDTIKQFLVDENVALPLSRGKRFQESKDDLKARGEASPDDGDTRAVKVTAKQKPEYTNLAAAQTAFSLAMI
jgi:hypothetical protein